MRSESSSGREGSPRTLHCCCCFFLALTGMGIILYAFALIPIMALFLACLLYSLGGLWGFVGAAWAGFSLSRGELFEGRMEGSQCTTTTTTTVRRSLRIQKGGVCIMIEEQPMPPAMYSYRTVCIIS